MRDRYLPIYYRKHKGSISTSTILKSIENGNLFGMVEVDIEVPTKWEGSFKHNYHLILKNSLPYSALVTFQLRLMGNT